MVQKNVKKPATHKKRARTEEEKNAQRERIIEAGKNLFGKLGTHGFGMRALAAKLSMSEANLYNYYDSKRELWIDIRRKYYQLYLDGLNKLIEEHEGNFVDLGVKWANYFLDFAAEDFKRFEIMNLIPAPRSEKVGKIEANYKPFRLMDHGLNVIKQAVQTEKLNGTDVTELFYFLYSIVFGAAITEAGFKLRSDISEPLKSSNDIISPEKFRKFVLKEIRNRLEKMVI